jgi:hydrophobe/amphiphile efflux-1 (HAE1) family protein
MSLSQVFIRRPIANALLMAGILVFGLASFALLPIAALPNVDFPTIVVQTNLPGASPQTMASSVATPLEQSLAGIAGLAQMSSMSGLGSTLITLQFDLARNIDGAAQDVQAAINSASGVLPKNLPSPPAFWKSNPANQAILIYAVSSDAMPIQDTDQYAYNVLAESLSRVDGVAQVYIAGQQVPATHVQVNPDALASRGVSLADVRTALVNATINLPKGNLEGRRQQFTLDTNDQLFDAEAFRHIIAAYRNGAPVQIKDIGEVINSSQSARTGAWFNGKRSELLMIERQPGANTIKVVDRIEAMMPELEASIPPSVHVDLVSDRSQNIRDSVADVELTLSITIGLVVLAIFVFLRKVWATIIPSVTVPLALVATAGVMYVVGYSLDNVSLMALTISVGFVVDDAIVMIENIVRYIERGEAPFAAAIKGAGQIGFTIVSITFSLIAVFIPLLFMGGIIGRLFREFAVTVTVAVVASAFVSLTLTPMMCSRFLKHEEQMKQGPFSRGAEGLFNAMLRDYDRGLRWVFRHQLLMLVSTLCLIVLTGYLYIVIPKGFIPQQDTGFIFGALQTRQDASFAAVAKLETEVSAVIQKDPAVSGVVGFAGATGYNPSESTARMFIQLKPFRERDGVETVIARLKPQIAKLRDVKFFMQAGQDVTVGGRLVQAQYQYTLTDNDAAQLNHWAPILLRELRGMAQLADVASDQQIASPNVSVTVDRDAAYRLGLSMGLIDQTLYDAFGQEQVTTVYTDTSQRKVILEVEPRFQKDPSALSHIYVASASGAQVPLSAVAHYRYTVQPQTVNHQGVSPAVTLSFNLAPGVSLGQAVDAIQAMQAAQHVPAALHGEFQGTARAFPASLASTPLLVAAAILVVYIVLGMLYESFIHPITILSALPSAGVGALLMLMLFGYDLSLVALIGIILLIGIVKKNAIMMIDFALAAERREGKSPLAAIHEACLLRFRPIMMTTMCALFGGLPLAVGHGAGSELRRPLGIAIVGGLLVSQALTLYTTPVIYLYLDRLLHWLAPRRHHASIGVAEHARASADGAVSEL